MISWREEAAAQKERMFLWIPVAFGAGVAAYFGLDAEPHPFLGIGMAAFLIPFLARAWRGHHESLAHYGLYLLLGALFCAAAGFFAAQAGMGIYGTPVLAKPVGPKNATGHVESVENLGGREGSRVVLSNVTIEDVARAPRKVRVRFKKDDGIAAGQMISALVKLDPPSQAVAPGAYDFRRHLFFDGIGGVGFAYSAATIIEPAREGGAALFFERLRQRIDARITEEAGPVTAGIMTALITGERGAIADEDNEAMRDSGLYHLLSISGSHVCMVAGVIFFFTRFFLACFPWAALHWPIKKIAAVAALAASAFYVVLAGAEVPAVRALMMTGLVMLAVMLDRSPLSPRLIAFSALVVLAVVPHSLVGVSFQMSFAAVAALICFFDYIRPWWMAWYSRARFVGKAMMYLAGILLTSIIAGGVTAFFTLYHFQQFAVYGVLSNMLAVPLTGLVIMPAAILALLLMPFGLAAPAIKLMEWGVVWLLGIAHWAAGLSDAVIHVVQWPQAAFALFVPGMILFLLWRGWRGKGAAAVLMIAGLACTPFAIVPDLFVAASGKMTAVRGDDGDLYFSSGRKDKFAAENWQRLSGHEDEKPKTFKDAAAPVRCDDAGCRTEIAGRHVAIVHARGAYFEDRDWADVIIADIPLPEERDDSGKVVIDLYDALDDGAHTVYLRRDTVRVRSVGEEAGARPWSK